MRANDRASHASTRRRIVRPLLLLLLAAVGLHTAIAFAAAAGRSTQVASTRLVLVHRGIQLPSTLSSLRYSGSVTHGHRLLVWRPAALRQQADGLVQIERPGDLALVDLTHASRSRVVTIYLTNLAALRTSYASIALPLAVWEQGRHIRKRWVRSSAPPTFITDATGRVSFSLPRGRLYDITLERGGSMATLPGKNLQAPAFFATLG